MPRDISAKSLTKKELPKKTPSPTGLVTNKTTLKANKTISKRKTSRKDIDGASTTHHGNTGSNKNVIRKLQIATPNLKDIGYKIENIQSRLHQAGEEMLEIRKVQQFAINEVRFYNNRLKRLASYEKEKHRNIVEDNGIVVQSNTNCSELPASSNKLLENVIKSSKSNSSTKI
ncbi:uncharacterized protein LOC119684910 [Teleopsis dalmanni]|uniref:uncharacterized protein LOC119662134 n=1 Tax=Teleopsis dalmanni TaxID=139649 RepID=UPI0018CE9E8E|nr:uncharacterized protein LOC119662134 [Teleopsis dalmanni]XP_037954975.1 uncharacterized protein LOC119684910 [Teleopsis dalmanni]